MSKRKSKAPFAKWYKSCLKQLPKKNCDQLVAITKRRVSKVSFRGLGSAPDGHAELAWGNIKVSIEAEGRADHAFATDNCREAYNWGLRALSASRSAIEHALVAENPVVLQRARDNSRVVESLVNTKLPKCLKKSPSF